jgi:hypothetical protein
MFFYGLLEAAASATFGKDGLHNLIYIRQMLLNLLKYDGSTPYEHAGIPVVIAFFEKALGSGEVWFLGEAFYFTYSLSV